MCKGAARELKKLKRYRRRDALEDIGAAIDGLKTNPRPQGVEKLSDTDRIYRITAHGSFRIIYQIRDKDLRVLVAVVSDRKTAYRKIFEVVAQRIASTEALLQLDESANR